jgi:hypothetical protein
MTSRNCIVYLAKLNDQYGLLDKNGSIIEQFIYESGQSFIISTDIEGEYINLQKNNKYALYSATKGILLTDFIYDSIEESANNRFLVSIDKKYGFIGGFGETITPLIFDSSYQYFNEDLVQVEQNNKFGMINLTGELVIPCQYEQIKICSEGLIAVENSKIECGYIDKNNSIVIPFGKYLGHSSFNNGLAKVFDIKKGKEVYINKSGKELEIKV